MIKSRADLVSGSVFSIICEWVDPSDPLANYVIGGWVITVPSFVGVMNLTEL